MNCNLLCFGCNSNVSNHIEYMSISMIHHSTVTLETYIMGTLWFENNHSNFNPSLVMDTYLYVFFLSFFITYKCTLFILLYYNKQWFKEKSYVSLFWKGIFVQQAITKNKNDMWCRIFFEMLKKYYHSRFRSILLHLLYVYARTRVGLEKNLFTRFCVLTLLPNPNSSWQPLPCPYPGKNKT